MNDIKKTYQKDNNLKYTQIIQNYIWKSMIHFCYLIFWPTSRTIKFSTPWLLYLGSFGNGRNKRNNFWIRPKFNLRYSDLTKVLISSWRLSKNVRLHPARCYLIHLYKIYAWILRIAIDYYVICYWKSLCNIDPQLQTPLPHIIKTELVNDWLFWR